MLSTYERRSRLKLATTIISIAVIAGVVVFADHLKSIKSANVSLTSTTTPAPVATTSSNSTPSPAATSSSTSSSGYKDGTYNVLESYGVPHGEEQIQVSLTLSNGTITSASIQNSENDFDSASYQEEFASGYKNYVVGKKISGLKISVIAGASDTTNGFNAALSKIASQAQA